jgi:REP element-mobilizing transposase RayT
MQIRKQMRLLGYDYSSYGYYYVTICIQDRIEYFGNVINHKMILNENGKIVHQQLMWLIKQYQYIKLDEWCIMPNHVHAILIINDDPVGVGCDQPLRTMHVKPLFDIIGAFKTTSSKLIHQSGLINFKWQRSFHDHIIRNETELYFIRKYIKNNPSKWWRDRNNNNMQL